jgi:hypothetical protein
VEGYEDGVPDAVLNPKKKVWEKLSVDLKTSAEGLGKYRFCQFKSALYYTALKLGQKYTGVG